MTAPQRPVPLSLILLAFLGFALLLAVVGVLFIRSLAISLGGHATQSEQISNLKALFVSQKAYQGEKGVYAEDMGRLGFIPERGNRYSYFYSARGLVLSVSERDRWTGPYHVVPADPDARRFRGAFSSYAETGCPLATVTLPDGTTAGVGVTPVPGKPGEAIFIGAAAANLDDDATVDCWSIATETRVAADGTPILAGQVHNEVNDVTH